MHYIESVEALEKHKYKKNQLYDHWSDGLLLSDCVFLLKCIHMFYFL